MIKIVKLLKRINYWFLFFPVLIIYFIVTQTKNEPFVENNNFECKLIENYIENGNLIRFSDGVPLIPLNKYIKDTIENDLIFLNKEFELTGLFKVRFNCSENIFLDSYKLLNGDVLRIQMSFSKDNKFIKRYHLVFYKSGLKAFLNNIEFVELLKRNPYLITDRALFYGLNFKTDTIVDLINKKTIIYDKTNNFYKYLKPPFTNVKLPQNF